MPHNIKEKGEGGGEGRKTSWLGEKKEERRTLEK